MEVEQPKDRSARPSVVYIMGRGHSGSTVLDGLLGNCRDTVGVGELISGLRLADPICSCGKGLVGCPLWAAVTREFPAGGDPSWSTLARALSASASFGQFPKVLRAKTEDSEIASQVELNRRIFQTIAAHADARIVVDSSKEITRGLFLARFLPEARVIHLVRHPDGPLESLARRMAKGGGFIFFGRRYSSGALAPFYIVLTSLTWLVGNLAAEVVRRVAPDRVMRLRYETLCERPGPVLKELCEFLGIDGDHVAQLLESEAPMPMGHKIGGNGMRMQPEFRFAPKASAGDALARPYRWIARLVTWPLLLAYGYAGPGARWRQRQRETRG